MARRRMSETIPTHIPFARRGGDVFFVIYTRPLSDFFYGCLPKKISGNGLMASSPFRGDAGTSGT